MNEWRQLGDQLNSQGLLNYKQSQYNTAAEQFEAASIIARAIGNKDGEGTALGNLGNLYMGLRQYDKAAEKFEAALEITREIGDRKKEGVWLGKLGSVYIHLGQYDKAAEKFAAALEIAREIGDRKGEGRWLDNLGIVFKSLGQYDKAAEKIEAALEIAREIGDRKIESSCLGFLGYVYTMLGLYNMAAEKLEAALEIAREIGDRKEEGVWLDNLGNLYMGLGHYDKSAEMFEVALEIAREVGNREEEGTALGNLGIVFKSLGQYDKAAERLKAALMMSQEIGDRNGEGMLLGNLGIVYMDLEQSDKAAEKYELALEIAREIGDRNGESTRLGNLSNVYTNLRQYDKAAEKLEAALKIAREIGDRKGEGVFLGNLANSYHDLGQYDKAAENLEPAVKIAREIGDREGEGTMLGNLGIVFKSLRQYDKAAEKLEAALEIAREIRDRQGEGRWLGNLGIVFKSLRQYDKAAEKLEAALEIAREIRDRQGEGRWLGNLGLLHYTKSDNHEDHQKALDYLEESIHVFDDLWMHIKEDDQRITFDDVNGSSSTFAKYLHSIFWNRGHFEDALVTREKASSKSLESLLLENRKDTLSADDTLGQKNQSLPTLPSVTNFEKMRDVAILSKSTIIVYGLHVDGDILIWVIKNGKNAEDRSLVHEKVPVKKEYISLQYLVESTRRSLEARDETHSKKRLIKGTELSSLKMSPLIHKDKPIADFNYSDLQAVEDELRKAQHGSIYGPDIMMNNALRELYNLLILPIEGALADEQRLTIIPSRDLFALPFAALVDQNGTHLIEKHILSFAPSFGTLVELEHNRNIPEDNQKGSAVIVGTGADLSGARKEAEQVHNIITNSGQGRDVMKFIGKEATKEAVIDAMQSADIIHLATHGSKDGISLSGPIGEDVKLTMGEVQSLDLKGTKMVVLSACDTFKGDLRRDGVVDITHSFLAAGSSTVIASLWPVNDYSTKEMMVRLYEFMFQNESAGVNDREDGTRSSNDSVDVSYALQQVMIGMLREEGGIFDVIDWAPFLVYGLNTSLGGKKFEAGLKKDLEKSPKLLVHDITRVDLYPKSGQMTLQTLFEPISCVKITMDCLQEVDEDGNVITKNQPTTVIKDREFVFEDKEVEKQLAIGPSDDKEDDGARGDSLSFSTSLENGSRFKVDAALVTKIGRVGSTYNGWQGYPGDFKFSFEVSDWDWETSGAYLDLHVDINVSVGKVLPTISSKTFMIGNEECLLELTREYFEIDDSSNEKQQKFMPEGFPKLAERGDGKQFFIFRLPRFETKVLYDPWLWFLRSRSGSFAVRSRESSRVNSVMFGYDRLGLTVDDYFNQVIARATSSVFPGVWQQYEIIGVQGQNSLWLDNESINTHRIDHILRHIDPWWKKRDIDVFLVRMDPGAITGGSGTLVPMDPSAHNNENNPNPSAITGGSVTRPRRFDTFISHNWGLDGIGRDNHQRVGMVNQALRTNQPTITTWYDEDEMQGNIYQRMSQGIEQSSTVTVFVTKRYIEKVNSLEGNDNCMFEFGHAVNHRTVSNMIPVVMEEGIPTPWTGPVGLTLGGHLYYNFRTDDELDQCVDDLVKQIIARRNQA